MKRGWIIGMILLCAGCASDDSGVPVNGTDLIFSLVNSASEPAGGRAAGTESENRIVRLDVFFYGKDGRCLFYPEKYQVIREGTKLIVVVPDDKSAELFGVPLDLYVLANVELPRSELKDKTLAELQAVVQENRATFNPPAYADRDSFLMDGRLEITIPSSGAGNLGTIQLRRAAAKVVVKISSAHVDDYTATEAFVRMSNYLDKTTLGNEAPFYDPAPEDFRESDYRPVALPGITTDDPGFFYSYANDWESEHARESYVTIAVKWAKNAPAPPDPRMYYYRIPFSYLPFPPGDGNRYRLRRNYIYAFDVDIADLGGSDPEDGVVLTPNFELTDWTTREIEIKLDPLDYLFVEETYVEIHDITDRAIHYTSSRPISITVDSVFYYEYLPSGKINVIKRNPGTEFYPRFNINTSTSDIEVSSKVPINYVPGYIDFTVKHDKGLSQKVRIVQYPRQYVTSERSSGVNVDDPPINGWVNSGNGRDGYRNFNFYTVTTTSLSVDDPFVIGGGNMTETISHQIFGTLTRTKQDEATNRMVSPKFVIATQRGITASDTQQLVAVERCHTYSEAQYPKFSWRLPTLAEMVLISRIQRDDNSALKGLFINGDNPGSDTWWSARREALPGVEYLYAVRVNQGETVRFDKYSGYDSPGSSVRCVHDVWKDQ